MYREFRDRVDFYVVYIQEAHASDMWQLPVNEKDGVIFAAPKTQQDRSLVASACVRKLGLELPALIDGIDNAVDMAYTGWPDRLYVIDKDGYVRYKSGPGPFGFHPEEMRPALAQVAGQNPKN
ncbi:MAG: hypothetical protein J0H49_22005 [Acidobacteria bacterium]|nr:hypothetical protein [Acidobacteriota bacterium]